MHDITNVIEVENLTKSFRVLHRGQSMKSAFVDRLRRQLRHREEWTALQDISFSVPKGQAVGVIGRNGAGKSTLLSLMARIYRPTSGRVEVHGRVAAMLSLTAGFNPDFTGLENIYLHGVIMGLTRREVEMRVQQILEYAEVQEFADTPTKHYSSGMLARLGFAVSVAVVPDVLLVDEVLAVGDVAFKEKCYRKFEEFKSKGIALFLVAHNMSAINRVCDRVLWIDDHKIRMDGETSVVVAAYNEEMKAKTLSATATASK